MIWIFHSLQSFEIMAECSVFSHVSLSYISFKWANFTSFTSFFPWWFWPSFLKKKKPGNLTQLSRPSWWWKARIWEHEPNAGVFPPNLNPLNAGKKIRKSPIRWSNLSSYQELKTFSKTNTSVANEGPTRVAQRPLRKKNTAEISQI